MSWINMRRTGECLLACALLLSAKSASAEIELGEAKGWKVATDGRVNGFASHVWGENRPEGLENLNWVGFNESNNSGQLDEEGKIRRTRIRGGFVPSTLGFSFRKLTDSGLKLTARVEIGMQIANIDPTFLANPTWMDPRAVYFDVEGVWGRLRVGRDFGLFSRGNLFMNYELGHAYGVGFPCAYEKVFGGACGHVGFGTLWPDFHAQLTYTTPKVADVVELSVGVFDPRTVPTYSWTQTPLPRVEGELVADYYFSPGWGFKAFANGTWQQVGLGADVVDETTFAVVDRKNYTQTAFGVGGGVIGYFGPAKLGASGYMGEGMDGFEFLGFNPIFVGQDTVENHERRFRPTSGILVEGSVTFADFTVMGGFGRASMDRLDTDIPIDTLDAFPLLRSQTGISTGVFYRYDDLVFGIDYFNAHYGFDPRLTTQEGGGQGYIEAEQTVHILNGGATLEW